MSEKLITSTSPAPRTSSREADSGGSRSSSPDMALCTLEHSMESLINSDSSEECVLEGSPVEDLEGTPNGNDEVIVQVVNEEESKASDEAFEDTQEEKGTGKRRKRRISSRRERKISLTSSDKVVSKVAGVQIEVIKQGYLLQQGSFQRWNKRYFTITADKLFVSKNEDEKLREEIILKDMTVAENSSKNINHSFTVLTPFQQEVVLAAPCRKEMEQWVSAFKLAASKSRNAAVLEALQHLEGQHSWFACTHSRPTYCNVCKEALHGVAWHGLSCEVCKFKSHRRCVFRVDQVCKWTTRSSLDEAGVQLGQDFAIPHQWLEGNLPTGSKCSVCDRACGSIRRLQDFRCLWCKFTVHTECKDKMEKVCTLGEHSLSILPPSALQRSDVIRKGMWEPYQVYGHSPVLACANSKSGENLGVKFLRRLKFWLNPAQVFDLAINGPELGLQLFQRFEKFRIIVLGGDGSIGWVLSTVDKYNLHSKCMVGVVPLGTGNDLARVLGWGSQCREEEKLPSILSEMEHSSFKLLDRWSLQYTPDMSVDMSTLFRAHSPTKPHDGTLLTAPFPAPAEPKSSHLGADVVSPVDSVFGSTSSDGGGRSPPELTPSPDRVLLLPKSSPLNEPLSPSWSIGEDKLSVGRSGSSGSGEKSGGEKRDRVLSCSSPQNSVKICAFHKSLSDLAHTFSSILISEDEKDVLQSAEILGGVVQNFLSSVVADMESEMSDSDFKSDPLVQKCTVLQDKLTNLVDGLKTTPTAAPPPEKKFVQREAMMARANSLKKAISSVIDFTAQALDTHAEEMDEIRQLTADIGSTFKARGVRANHASKDSVSSISSVVEPAPLLPKMKEISVMNNYCGLGLDAKIVYQFNSTREKKPAQYKSRTKNKMLYGLLGGKEFLTNSQRYLERKLTLECDGEVVELPQRLQGLVFLNIPSYMAGVNFWGTGRERDGFSAPSHDDKLMEVVAVSGLSSIATAMVLGIQNHRLCQCRVAKVTVTEELAIQVDGEAWLQKPGTIIVSHKNKARMLVKDKAFTQTLESWKQKHSLSSAQLSVPQTVTSTLQQALTKEELDRYRELAAAIPPLIGYIKSEAENNAGVRRDLLPYVSSVSHTLDRIFLEGGLVSDTADVLHLQDFEHNLKALVQETLWFLSMQRISAENEAQMKEAVKSVETHMRRLLSNNMAGSLSSSNLSDCSQAHHNFRRGSDTLLMTRPPHLHAQYSPNLSPHRERTAQLIPDETIQAVSIVKKIGKEVGMWEESDVQQWLEGLGLGEYMPNLTKHGVTTGRELLCVQKSDLQDMGITKVAHSTRLYRALQALGSRSPPLLHQRSTGSSLHPRR